MGPSRSRRRSIVMHARFCDPAGVERQRVASKAVLSVGYDEEASVLELEFRAGRVYRYEEVPRSVVEWLLRTKNTGGFVTRMISGRYREQAVHYPDGGAGGARAADAGVPTIRPDSSSLEQALRASLAMLCDAPRQEAPRGLAPLRNP